jgi:PadR family transcriptional regulator, regulatory protein PadR
LTQSASLRETMASPLIPRTSVGSCLRSLDGERYSPACDTAMHCWVDILPEAGRYSGKMSTQNDKEKLVLRQGTLDLLILRTLIFGPQHGQRIARVIQETSEEELLVEHGALYPALQRLEERGWLSAKWGISSNNRKARFYTLTAAGHKRLGKKTTKWRRLAKAIGRILESEPARG